ncbi:MAG: SDR family oxidoreductase [Pseudomonadota bacterium]
MSRKTSPVLILGARSDMARAIASEYAKLGHPIWLAARNSASLERDAADLGVRFSADVTCLDFDVEDFDGHSVFLDGLPETPAIVVCAVGLLGDQDKDAGDNVASRKIFDVNFSGPVLLLEALAARMVERPGKTAIIGIGSVAGDRGRAKNYVYGSAKAGFAAYLSGLRQRYVNSRLQVMTVKPGFVRTAMTEGMDLPGPLTTDASSFGARVVAAQRKGRRVYYDFRWWLVMTIIRLLPEPIFVKLKF